MKVQIGILIACIIGMIVFAGINSTQTKYIEDTRKKEYHMSLADSVTVALERSMEQ